MATTKKKPRAPVTTYKEWEEPDKLILLEGWARDGLSQEQIAHNVGVRRQTIGEWKKKSAVIAGALKKGAEIIDYEVENALVKRIKGFTTKSKQTFITQTAGITTKRVVITETEHAPDTTAIIFWLKNRRPDKWRRMAPAFERKTEAEAIKLEKEIRKLELEIAQLENPDTSDAETIVIIDEWADAIAEEIAAGKKNELEEKKEEQAARDMHDRLAHKKIDHEIDRRGG